MKALWICFFGLCVAVTSMGCQPLTYSHDEVIDFSQFRAAFVSVNDGNAYHSEYLAAELREKSGFTSVTTDGSDTVDAYLDVSLDVQTTIETDSEGRTSTTYHGYAQYAAYADKDTLLCVGQVEDSSFTYDETVEDTLDEVAQVFEAAYRI